MSLASVIGDALAKFRRHPHEVAHECVAQIEQARARIESKSEALRKEADAFSMMMDGFAKGQRARKSHAQNCAKVSK